MDKKLFQKYLNNRCTPDELEKTFVWFKEEAGNLHNQMMVQQLWKKYNSSEAKYKNTHFERILDKIHHNINLLNAEKGQIKNTLVHDKKYNSLIFSKISYKKFE